MKRFAALSVICSRAKSAAIPKERKLCRRKALVMKMRAEMKQKRHKAQLLSGLLCALAVMIGALGVVHASCPDVISVYGTGITENGTYHTSYQKTLTIAGIIPVKEVTVNAYEETMLYPGGMLFGVRCATEGVVVVAEEDVETADGRSCPAKAAGIRAGDIIMAVDGAPAASADALAGAVDDDGRAGRSTTLTVRRGEETLELSLTPCKGTDGVYRAGMWTRDATAGIGTVTFIDPETGLFGGLGHGICDTETGALLPLSRGITRGVTLSAIVPGEEGKPGELRGSFSGTRTGTLCDNTAWGVFGVFSSPETMTANAAIAKPIPIGHRSEVHEGEASILCTLDNGSPAAYAIRIVSVGDPTDTSNKNFVIEVTDGDLLAKTGGIVQGMSGSPILQDGRLIGAVTHVTVNRPERGYGIFIENMLAAAGEGNRDA